MCPDDTEHRDPTGDTPESTSIDSPAPDPATAEPASRHWSRRTFLKAAALGTAAAALVKNGEGLRFGPLAALADDLSGLNCTANDVRIVGPGQIINEPCNCTGTFNAQVKFRVINNTGTTRYCVTVHFCPGKLDGGGTFSPGDVLIGDIPAKSDAFYTVTIPNYPCGSGLVCFGECGPGTDPDTGKPDCSFPKGAACPSGKCCTTISWDVNPGCPKNVISSKCRHQQVCIQGRGSTTLDCDTSATGLQTTCNVECGATTTVRACTSNPASLGPFTYTLSDGQSFGPTTDTCHDFTVGPITEDTTIDATITDKDGCSSKASVTLKTAQITVTLDVSGGDTCGSGDLTFTASTGKTGCSYAFSVDGKEVQNSTSNTYSYSANPDSACHTVSVVATCGGCVSNTASKTVKQCVQTTTGC
ncbi:MAG: twin-arginine translocation signal domain-containing protein [Dactylosporangium sp.]|nr:twin-arginine translocation signal domain-containing protein [Dactylosporangium sp.]